MSKKQRINETREEIILEEEEVIESGEILCDSCDHKNVCKYVEDMRRIETETENKYNKDDRPVMVVLDCESYSKLGNVAIKGKLPWNR